MKNLFLLMIFACTNVFAESRVLPPVIDRSIYPEGVSHSTATPPSANVMYEMLGRLEQMQSEIQQLRGQVEEQAQMISDLKKRQNNIYSDLDQRLLAISGGVVDQDNVNNQTAEQSNMQMTVVKQQKAVSQKPTTAVAKSGKTEAPAPIVEKNQKEMYQTAYETLRNGHNTRAIALFKELLAEFPNGDYADNAQYWLGEAYKVNQDLNSAKIAFNKVVNYYKTSPKVADALLKLGYIELEQNNMAKARDYLTEVTVNYPGTTASHLATKKLEQLGVIQP